MNIYAILGLAIAAILVGHFFNLGPAIEQFANRVADIPAFDNKGSNPAIFDLAVRLAYLVVVVGIARLILSRNKDD